VSRLRVLIVDDEPLARRRLQRLAGDEGVEVVGVCENGEEAVEAIRTAHPELVLLDVQMPGMNGFDVVSAVGPERMPLVVFVTAFDQYAIPAFEIHAVDYLLKPVEDTRFRVAITRAKERLERRETASQRDMLSALLDELRRSRQGVQAAVQGAQGGREPYLERLLVTMGGRSVFLHIAQIDWIEADGNYARLHVGDRSCLIRETMNALEARLDPRQFLRTHRSTIVNLDRVKELQPWFRGNYVVRLTTGAQLQLSRRYRARMQAQIGKYI
jgi:two-component system LytT family response regulator